MEERERRLAQNEAVFREASERIRRVGGDRAEFICECADKRCTAQVALSLDEYEAVRRDPKQFVVLPGHQIPDIEEIVREEQPKVALRRNTKPWRRIRPT
jgi:hypothetical protein